MTFTEIDADRRPSPWAAVVQHHRCRRRRRGGEPKSTTIKAAATDEWPRVCELLRRNRSAVRLAAGRTRGRDRHVNEARPDGRMYAAAVQS